MTAQGEVWVSKIKAPLLNQAILVVWVKAVVELKAAVITTTSWWLGFNTSEEKKRKEKKRLWQGSLPVRRKLCFSCEYWFEKVGNRVNSIRSNGIWPRQQVAGMCKTVGKHIQE